MTQTSTQDGPSIIPASSRAILREHLIEWAHGRLSAAQVLELHPEISLDGMRFYARGSRSQTMVKRNLETVPLLQSLAVFGEFLNEFRCRPADYLKAEGRAS